MSYRSYVEPHMHAALANHTLEVHVDTPELKAWYLRHPTHGRPSSTLLLFTVEGIVIMGDLCPGQDGVISTLGYGVGWFSGRLSEQYLCSKFLRCVFVPEIGARELRERIIEARRCDGITKDDARDAYRELLDRGSDLTGESAYRIHSDAGLVDFESLGYDYDPSAAGWLCAIQQRFAQLYTAATSPVLSGASA